MTSAPARKTPGPSLTSARTPARKVPGPPGPTPTRSGVNITPITPKTVPGPAIPTASSNKKTAGSGVRISTNKTSMKSNGVSANSKSVKRPASPEIVVDKHFRVGKAVKITQIQDNKAARISATANLPSSTKPRGYQQQQTY